jgi:hypothetical protein
MRGQRIEAKLRAGQPVFTTGLRFHAPASSRCSPGAGRIRSSSTPSTVLTEPHAVRRLLAALGLAAEPPPAPVLPAA